MLIFSSTSFSQCCTCTRLYSPSASMECPFSAYGTSLEGPPNWNNRTVFYNQQVTSSVFTHDEHVSRYLFVRWKVGKIPHYTLRPLICIQKSLKCFFVTITKQRNHHVRHINPARIWSRMKAWIILLVSTEAFNVSATRVISLTIWCIRVGVKVTRWKISSGFPKQMLQWSRHALSRINPFSACVGSILDYQFDFHL